MTAVRILLTLALAVAIYAASVPQHFSKSVERASLLLHDIWYEKKLSIRGLRILSVETIREHLPRDHSTAWWILNSSIIEGELLQNPFIRKASVDPCSSFFIFSWGCFVIDLEERELRFIAPHKGSFLLLGQDGSSLGAVPIERLESAMQQITDKSVARPKMLNGLIPDDGSTDITRARFNYVTKVIHEVEKETALLVTRAHLHSNGEVTIKTQQHPFSINFDSSQENPDRLTDELQRLKRLFIEIQGREETIDSIDLAFDKITVIKPKE